MAEQVRRDHGVVPGQRVDHRLPGGVVAAEAVEQQEHRTRAGLDERAPVAVDGDVLDLVRLSRTPSLLDSPVNLTGFKQMPPRLRNADRRRIHRDFP